MRSFRQSEFVESLLERLCRFRGGILKGRPQWADFEAKKPVGHLDRHRIGLGMAAGAGAAFVLARLARARHAISFEDRGTVAINDGINRWTAQDALDPVAPGGVLFEHGERFYNFKGLRAFKSKFHPKWEPRYVANVSAGCLRAVDL